MPSGREHRGSLRSRHGAVSGVAIGPKRTQAYDSGSGRLCRVAEQEEIIGHNFTLTPGRYVGSSNGIDDDEDFEEKMQKLVIELKTDFKNSNEIEKLINKELEDWGYGS